MWARARLTAAKRLRKHSPRQAVIPEPEAATLKALFDLGDAAAKLLETGSVPTAAPTDSEPATDLAKARGRLQFDENARAIWHKVYAELSEGKPGLLGAVTARGEAHVVRLALTYALLDCADEISTEHLMAALAVWEYCERSAAWIFGTATGDPVADRVMSALRGAPDGLTRTEIRNLFSRHESAERMGRVLDSLEATGRVEQIREDTAGRPVERYRIPARKAT
jgi:DNA replicative helicase MCM subunit Mcm2 (Cdc46/Mcm family)